MCFGIFALYNLIFIQEITCIKVSYKSGFVLIMTIPDGNRKPRILTIYTDPKPTRTLKVNSNTI